MRRLLITALMTGVAHSALAADMPLLRGGFSEGVVGPPVVDWQGVYIGGQAGWGSSNIRPRNKNEDLVGSFNARIPAGADFGPVSALPLSAAHADQTGYGGFIGYNSQWDDVVVGIEGSFLHGKFGAESVSRSPDLAGQQQSFSSTRMTLKDFGSLRLRAGYVWGVFMPYAFGGLALGRADIVRQVGVTRDRNGAILPPSAANTETSIQNDRFVYGYAAGLGVDFNLYAGLFLRAEWEYLRFTSSVDTNINTVRAGLGYKF